MEFKQSILDIWVPAARLLAITEVYPQILIAFF